MQKKDYSPPQNEQKPANPGSTGANSSITSKPASKPSSKPATNPMTTKCGSCDQKIPMQEITKHLLTCNNQTRKCYIGRCTYEGMTEEFLEHIRLDHAEDLLSAFAKDIPMNRPEETKTIAVDDPIVFRKNRAGLEAKLGQTGKYYCQGKLNGICYEGGTRGCCNGYCGPTNGCNCRACMELDIDSRKLPKEYWVNRLGRVCTKGMDGRVYCGGIQYYGNQCAPTTKTQCSACKSLEFQLADRYCGVNFLEKKC